MAEFKLYDDLLSSGFLNIDLTCLICGCRSGAERSSPRIVLDWKVSEASASSESPVLNDLKAYTREEWGSMAPEPIGYGLRTVRTFKKSFTLQFFAWMRETMRSKSGRPLATLVNSASKVAWSSRSWTASSLKSFQCEIV